MSKCYMRVTPSHNKIAIVVYDNPDFAPSGVVDDWFANLGDGSIWESANKRGFYFSRRVGGNTWEVNRVDLKKVENYELPRFEEVHPESDMQMLLRRVIWLEQQVEQMRDTLQAITGKRR